MPDTVEEMCPEMPRLDKLLKDVNDVSESGARYSDMPQVWEVVVVAVVVVVLVVGWLTGCSFSSVLSKTAWSFSTFKIQLTINGLVGMFTEEI